MNTASQDSDRRPTQQVSDSGRIYAAYALPVMLSTLLVIPTNTILPGIYAKHFGLELSAIAFVVLVARLFDAVTDPLVGHLSDRWCVRGGTRRPWVIAGGIGLIISAQFLYVPPQPVPVAYFLFWFMALYLAFTLMEIPHIAWGGELATGYQQRSRIYGYRAAFGALGQIAFFSLPLITLSPTREFTPDTLRAAVILCALLLLPALYLIQRRVPPGETIVTHEPESLRDIGRAILTNKPLLNFIATYLLVGLALGMWLGLLFIYLDAYLNLGEQVSLMFLCGTLAGLGSIPAWLRLIRHTSKRAGWATSMGLFAIAIGGYLFTERGAGAVLPTILTIALFVAASCQVVVAPAVLADVVDYGTWKFGRDRSATYFALYTLITKANMALGGATGLLIAGLFGFDPATSQHSATAVAGLRLAMAVLPALCLLGALVLVLKSPITPQRHAIVRRRIESRLAPSGSATRGVRSL